MELLIDNNLDDGPDNRVLEKYFDNINQQYFNGAVKASIQWGIPSGIVVVKTARPAYQLSVVEKERFEEAKKSETPKTIELLLPLAEKGHLESEFLLSHLLPEEDPRKAQFSKSYNQSFASETAVPAACYYASRREIVIHNYLEIKKAPQFVIKYLIYHECCHQIVESSQDTPHSEEFLTLEMQFKHRDKAIKWLQGEGFPTIDG